MFRELRRKNKEISRENVDKLLESARIGVLATNGDDGYPYSLPMNFYYSKNKNAIYFHSAKVGHKAESLAKSSKVCFTVFGKETIKEEPWAPFVESVVIFGKCRLIDDDQEAIDVLKEFAMKYYPSEEIVDNQIKKSFAAINMYQIKIEHITGKEVKEK